MLSYSPGKTIVHSVDARIKILWLVFFLGVMLSSRTVEMAVFSAAVATATCVLSSIHPFKSFLSFGFLAFILAVPVIFWFVILFARSDMSNPEAVLLVAAKYGLINAVIILCALSISILFIMTTDKNAIVAALRFFGVPASTAFSLSMAMFFLPILEREIHSVRVAQASRGHSAKNPIPLVIPFLHSVMRKARSFSISLDSRAFNPENAEIPHKLKMKPIDWFSLAVLVLIVYVRLYYFFG